MRLLSGIRSRLFLLALALSAPTFGLQLWRSTDDRREAIAFTRTRVTELVQAAAAEQADSLQEASNLLRVLKHVPAIVDLSQAGCHDLLREITNEHPRINTISVTHPDGSLACTSAQPIPPPLNFADRAWFRDATADNAPSTSISELLISRQTGTLTVVVATALQPPAYGAKPGTVSAAMNLGWFSEIASKILGQNGGIVQIVDARDGTVLASSVSPRDWVGKQFPDHPLIRRIQATPDTTAEVMGFDDVMRIVGFTHLPGDSHSRAVVVVSVPRGLVLAEANRHLFQGLLLTVLTLFAGLLAAWALAVVSIVRPLDELGGVAMRLGAGDFSARASSDRHRVKEFREVGQVLNSAAVLIEQRDKQLEALASKDGLTGLANRRTFDTSLAKEWLRAERTGSPLSLLMIDVDHFKLYNDTYGHPAGDECLRKISNAIAAIVRSASDVVARYGGEEIGVVLPETGPAGAIAIGRRVVELVQGLSLTHSLSPAGNVTISVGVATLIPTDHKSYPQQLTDAADGALYQAKLLGRGRAVAANDKGAAGSTNPRDAAPLARIYARGAQ